MSETISASMVKELRERTGSGMMECKRALVDANGDMELAIENMRKAGLAKADKKSGRIAAEGLIGVKTSADNKTVAMVEVNCETDFVAKSDEFKKFVDDIATALLAADVANDEALQALPIAGGQSVDEVRRALIAKLGEKHDGKTICQIPSYRWHRMLFTRQQDRGYCGARCQRPCAGQGHRNAHCR